VEANLTLLKQLQNTFVRERAAEKWRECCKKAEDCCRNMTKGRGVMNGEYYIKDFYHFGASLACQWRIFWNG
jgi:hypothetical protein